MRLIVLGSKLVVTISGEEWSLRRTTIAYWIEHPVWGYGFQSGESFFQQEHATGGTALTVGATHNSFLQQLLELGLLGIAALSLVLLAVAGGWWKERAGGLGLGLLAATLGGLLIMLTESVMFGTGQPFPWLFWVIATALLARTEQQGGAGTPRRVATADSGLRPGQPARSLKAKSTLDRHFDIGNSDAHE